MFKADFSSSFWAVCHKKYWAEAWNNILGPDTFREPAVLQQLNWHLPPLLAKMSTSCACLWLPQTVPMSAGLGQRTASRVVLKRQDEDKPNWIPEGPTSGVWKCIYNSFCEGRSQVMAHLLWNSNWVLFTHNKNSSRQSQISKIWSRTQYGRKTTIW